MNHELGKELKDLAEEKSGGQWYGKVECINLRLLGIINGSRHK
jgi:hypothetical protein